MALAANAHIGEKTAAMFKINTTQEVKSVEFLSQPHEGRQFPKGKGRRLVHYKD
jgi:hypothetical protein